MHWFVLITQVFLVFATSGSSYTTHYLEDNCLDGLSQTLWLDSSGPQSSAIIKISRKPGFRNDMDCSLVIKPQFYDRREDEQFGIALTVDNINLRTKQYNLCKDIFMVSLQKDDDDWKGVLYGCWRNLSGITVSSLGTSGNNAVKLDFKSSRFGPPASSEDALELTVTTQVQSHGSDCPKLKSRESTEWFKCSSKDRCIWKGLTCDLRNNCGDDSDEWTDKGAKCAGDSSGNGLVIGISVGFAVLAVIIIIAICCVRRRSNNSNNSSVPTAPLLSTIEIGPDAGSTEKHRMSTSQYGSTDRQEDPPPYDYQPSFSRPPPPSYKE